MTVRMTAEKKETLRVPEKTAPVTNPESESGGTERYSFSFMGAALCLPESVAVATLLSALGDWEAVGQRAAEENVLRKRTVASRTRFFREIRYRLEVFTPGELEFFCQASPGDQRLMLFMAICERFRFIREFVGEVLLPKLHVLERRLYPADLARFFDHKGAEAPEVERLTEISRAKVRQIMLRILAEAGLIDSTSSRCIRQPVPGKDLARLVAARDPRRLRHWLLSESDLQELTH